MAVLAHCSGDTDAVIPVTSTRYNIDALKLPTIKPWHAWYDDGQVIYHLSYVKKTSFLDHLCHLLLLYLSTSIEKMVMDSSNGLYAVMH